MAVSGYHAYRHFFDWEVVFINEEKYRFVSYNASS